MNVNVFLAENLERLAREEGASIRVVRTLDASIEALVEALGEEDAKRTVERIVDAWFHVEECRIEDFDEVQTN